MGGTAEQMVGEIGMEGKAAQVVEGGRKLEGRADKQRHSDFVEIALSLQLSISV